MYRSSGREWTKPNGTGVNVAVCNRGGVAEGAVSVGVGAGIKVGVGVGTKVGVGVGIKVGVGVNTKVGVETRISVFDVEDEQLIRKSIIVQSVRILVIYIVNDFRIRFLN